MTRHRPTWRRGLRPRRVRLPASEAEWQLARLLWALFESLPQEWEPVPVLTAPKPAKAKPARGPCLPWPRQDIDGTQLGIDVSKKAGDIRKLTLAAVGRQAVSAGLDPEDVVQAAYEAILRRNRMPSAYDPRRGGMSNYVHRLASNQLCNLIAVRQRHPLVVEDGEVVDMEEDGEAWAQLTSFVPRRDEEHLWH